MELLLRGAARPAMEAANDSEQTLDREARILARRQRILERLEAQKGGDEGKMPAACPVLAPSRRLPALAA